MALESFAAIGGLSVGLTRQRILTKLPASSYPLSTFRARGLYHARETRQYNNQPLIGVEFLVRLH